MSANSKSSKKIDTSNWKTYHNEEFKFEKSYPGDWSYNDKGLGGRMNVFSLFLKDTNFEQPG